jgi:hypothetical protein
VSGMVCVWLKAGGSRRGRASACLQCHPRVKMDPAVSALIVPRPWLHEP